MSTNRQVTCPKCGRADAVRKVSAIVTAGTRTGETAGLGLGIGADSPDFMAFIGNSASRSELAARLTLPKQPSRPRSYGWAAAFGFARLGLILIVGLALMSGLLVSFPFLFNAYAQNPTLILIPIAVIVIFLTMSIGWLIYSAVHDVRVRNEEHGSYESRLQAWQRMNVQWNELYYCVRDDGVFLPSQDVLTPSQELRKLLNRQVSKPQVRSDYDRTFAFHLSGNSERR